MALLRLALWTLVAATLFVVAYVTFVQGPQSSDPNVSKGSGSVTGVRLGGDFVLTSHMGSRFDTATLRGRGVLLYFGYSFCPDVCPVELRKMTRALLELEEEGLDTLPIQPVFVTVDPERDTTEVLADYVPDFHDRLLGLTGTKEDVQTAMQLFRINAQKADSGNPEYYLMNHTSLIFYLDEGGEVIRFFTARDSYETIRETLRARLTG